MNASAPFAPGSHLIQAHGGGAFAFAGMSHRGSILATPKGVRPIEAVSVVDLNERTLAPLFTEIVEAPGSIEFLVVGTGAEMALVETLRELRDRSLRHAGAGRSEERRVGKECSS